MQLDERLLNLEKPTAPPAKPPEQVNYDRLLAKIALRIRQSLNLDAVLNTAVAEVRQFLQTDRVIIYRFEPDWSGIVAVESVSPDWSTTLGTVIQESCFTTQTYVQLYQQGRLRFIEDIYTEDIAPCHVELLARFQVRANLVVPILQGEDLWGLLIAHHCSAPRRWQPLEIDLLEQLATHMAIAIQQSELYLQAQTELAHRQRAEAALRVSEERYALAVAGAKDGL